MKNSKRRNRESERARESEREREREKENTEGRDAHNVRVMEVVL